MAPVSQGSVYKAKLREDTTTLASRRKSRDIERKSSREDKVNKRRLISVEMSPVVEDGTSYKEDDGETLVRHTPTKVHKKASSRLELLQIWREEKKRKAEAEKKNKKPKFKVSPMKYKGESHLYTSIQPKDTKQTKKVLADQIKLPPITNTKKAATSGRLEDKSKQSVAAKSTRSQVVSKTATQPPAVQETHLRLTRQAVASNKSNDVNKAVQPKVKISDLSNKMTASAAAKAKANLEKPKEFLRAKSRNQKLEPSQSTKADSKSSKKHRLEQAASLDMVEVMNDQNLISVNASSSNCKEQHFSNQNATSPKHSTPAPLRSALRSKFINKERGSSTDTEQEVDDFDVPGLSVNLNLSAQKNLSRSNLFAESSMFDRSLAVPDQENKVMSPVKKIRKSRTQEALQLDELSVTDQENKVMSSVKKSIKSRTLKVDVDLSKGNISLATDNDVSSTKSNPKLGFTEPSETDAVLPPQVKDDSFKYVYSTPIQKTRKSMVSRTAGSSKIVGTASVNDVTEDVTISPARKTRKSTRMAGSLKIEAQTVHVQVQDVSKLLARKNSNARALEVDESLILPENPITKDTHVASVKKNRKSDAPGSSKAVKIQFQTKDNATEDMLTLIGKNRKSSRITQSLKSNEFMAHQTKEDEMSPVEANKSSIALDSKQQFFKRKSHQRNLEPEDVNDWEMSDKENLESSSKRLPEKKTRRSKNYIGDLTQNDQMSSAVRKEQRKNVTIDVLTPSVVRSYDRSQKRRMHRTSLINDETDTSINKEALPSPSKQAKRTLGKPLSLERGESSLFDQSDIHDTQLLVNGEVNNVQDIKKCPSTVKRRSVRIAGVGSSYNSSDDDTIKTKYPKTPRFRGHHSIRMNSSDYEYGQSTFVSISDEGTLEGTEENIVSEMKLTSTPRHTQHTPVSGRSTRNRKSIARSVLFDVSDEGTTVSGQVLNTVYHIGKPTDSACSSRALQELAVKKLEGEVSFIEVPEDDAVGTEVSPVEQSTDDDVAAIATRAESEDSTQSTQPFSPRVSSDFRKLSLSSKENTRSDSTPLVEASSSSHTPRSRRNRGLSMSGLPFKTPVQPTKSQKKRRKTHASSLKSPEEMIEILKKSPMVEMTRRKSRHIIALDTMNPTNLDTMLASCQDICNTETFVDANASNFGESSSQTESVTTDVIQLTKENGGIRHFRQLLASETERLNGLCNKWNEISEQTVELSEDAQGQIRTAVGKAQLLINKRFKQFSGLVDNCEFCLGEIETTLTDLQGFWEMIYIQVQDVDQLFATLKYLQTNNWNIKQPSATKVQPKRKLAAKLNRPSVKSNFAAFRDEMMKRKGQTCNSLTKVDTNNTDTKTFDAGYFQVTSPVKHSSGKKSQESNPLKVAVCEDQQSQDNSTSTAPIDNIPVTPVLQGNKENNVTNSGYKFLSAKRHSYLPMVPSPLLNDITGLIKK